MGATGYEAAVAGFRARLGDPVVVELQPDGTIMRGRLAELDAAGIDGALFALTEGRVGRRDTTGIAVALFRDAVDGCERDGTALVVRQGRVTVIVRPADG